jgi:hypothetical protein
VGSVAIAGCGSEDSESNGGGSSEEENDNTESNTEDQEKDPANFVLSDTSSVDSNVLAEEVTLSARITNEGEKTDTQNIKLLFNDKEYDLGSKTLEPNTNTDVERTFSLTNEKYKEYTYEFQTQDDEQTNTFNSVVQPFNEQNNVLDYSVEVRDDVTTEGTIRYDLDIVLDSDNISLLDQSIDDLKKVCMNEIYQITSREVVNAIGFNFWRRDQTIGGEQAQVIINWAPSGSWSQAGNVSTGDYSNHSFSVRGRPYVEVIEVEGPDIVEPNEQFSVDWTLKNRGFTSTEVTGWIDRSGDEVLKDFDIQLDINEEANMSIEDELGSFGIGEFYTINGSGASLIHGNTFYDVDLE